MDAESESEVNPKKSRKSVVWTKEILSNFLEQFESHACLYDTKSRFYSNKHARADALTKIKDSLNVPGITIDDIKQKINNVRTQVSHELKKVRIERSGDSAEDKYEPIWWFDLAQFLLPHIKCRKAHDSIENISNNNDVNDDETAEELGDETRKKKTKSTEKKEDDVVYNTTLETLRNISTKISTNTTVQDYKVQEFGNFIMKELSELDDEELLLEAKEEITNIIFKKKKEWIIRKKNDISLHNFNVFNIDK